MATSNSGVRVRDLDAHRDLSLPLDEVALRVPYDVFRLHGPAEVSGGMMSYVENGKTIEGRTRATSLGECKPGERVLVRETSLAKAPVDGAAAAKALAAVEQPLAEDEHTSTSNEAWALCEILEVSGQTVA